MPGTSGPTLPVPLGFYDPESRSLRTSRITFESASTLSSPTLPASGSMRSGALYARRRSALPTVVSGCSSTPLLPTPRTSDTNGAGVHGDGGMDLRTTVSLLPTPNASFPGTTANYRPDGTPYGTGYGLTLLDAARLLLPTPRASDGEKGGPNQRGSKGDLMLSSAVVQLLPTSNASDFKGSGATQGRTRDGRPRPLSDADLPEAVSMLSTSTGAVSPPPSPDGKPSSDDVPPGQLTIAIA